jgi:hypothetical protein
MAIIGYENIRALKFSKTFDGTSGNGANGSVTIDTLCINKDEFIYDVFYKVKTALTSGDSANTYLQVGIAVDDPDCVFNSTTGVVDTLNSGASGTKLDPDYTTSSIDKRLIVAEVGGTNDITAGVIEVYLVVMRVNAIDDTSFPSIVIPAP